MSAQPILKKRKGISPIWTLPILAIGLCAWLLYKSFMEAGIIIEVYFDDITGITPEKTLVMSRGMPFGVVKEIHPDIERNQVRTVIKMDRLVEKYLVEDATFWLVKPEISASRITGLETILSGSYIGVQRGKSTNPARTFTALPSAPPLPSDTPGLHIKLRSNALRSVQKGSSIYFRNLKIGSVQYYELEEDDSILIDGFILPQYSHLIRSGSRFYDASGVTFSGKVTDLKIRMESISSLFVGGIVVSTPEALQDTPLSQNGDIFTLYEDFEAADYGIAMTLNLASGTGISEGVTKVMYRGLEAGYVKRIAINDDVSRSVTAEILLDPRAEIILRESTQFWLVSPEISTDGVSNLSTIISGPYITFKPGDGEFKNHFEILFEPPAEEPLRPGKRFRLSSSETTVTNAGAPIYYRKVKIGEVLGSALSSDRKSVETSIFIHKEYADVILPNSVFIETGGISIDASLSGFSVNVDPLASVLKGGIDLLNPKNKSDSIQNEAEENSLFTLYPNHEAALAAIPALKPKGLYLQLSSADLGSYRPGSPILYKKITVGKVIGFKLSEKNKNVRLTCFIEKKYADLVTSNSKFYRASGIRVQGSTAGISVETESLESLISGGIGFFTEPGGKAVTSDSSFTVFDSLGAAESVGNSQIVVQFQNTDNLNIGAPVKYQGIAIGSVTKISFGNNLKTVFATLSVKKTYETFFRENTKIWLTTPNINLRRVKYLETALFGSFVTLKPGTGDITHTFIGLPVSPHPLFSASTGLNIILESKHLGSITLDSPIYYRQVQVGKVTGYNLAADFKDVLIYAAIDAQYAPIVRENTRFWNASGLKIKGGVFSGITVSTESCKSLF